MADQTVQPFLGRIGRFSHRVTPGRPGGAGIHDHSVIKFRFIPEMVVHCRDVDFGALGDHPNSGALKSVLRENFARSIEDLVSGIFLGNLRYFDLGASFSSYHAIIFKQSFETVK